MCKLTVTDNVYHQPTLAKHVKFQQPSSYQTWFLALHLQSCDQLVFIWWTCLWDEESIWLIRDDYFCNILPNMGSSCDYHCHGTSSSCLSKDETWPLLDCQSLSYVYCKLYLIKLIYFKTNLAQICEIGKEMMFKLRLRKYVLSQNWKSRLHGIPTVTWVMTVDACVWKLLWNVTISN